MPKDPIISRADNILKKTTAFLTAVSVFLTATGMPSAATAGESKSFWQDRRRSVVLPTKTGDIPKDAAKSEGIVIPSAPPPDVAGLNFPPSVGNIVDSYWPDLPASPDSPLVIHVQDAHGLYDAQKNLAEIIKTISDRREDPARPLLIAAEGAWGTLDFRWLKVYPDKTLRDQRADLLLRSGLLTGEEFLSVTDDNRPLHLFGARTRASIETTRPPGKTPAPTANWPGPLLINFPGVWIV